MVCDKSFLLNPVGLVAATTVSISEERKLVIRLKGG